MIYQDLHGLIRSVRHDNSDITEFDTSCFSGEYVTGDVTDEYLHEIEQRRNDTAKQMRARPSARARCAGCAEMQKHGYRCRYVVLRARAATAHEYHEMMIIDGQAEFRSLIMHHVTTHWPDAIISAYDPTEAGHLPDEFSGAGNDIVLLGRCAGDRDGLEVLKQFCKTPGFPAVVYFGNQGDDEEALKAGADAFFVRDEVRHDALTVQLGDILVSRRRVASTGSLFVGDERTGIHPLIRGYRFLENSARHRIRRSTWRNESPRASRSCSRCCNNCPTSLTTSARSIVSCRNTS